MFLKCCVIGEVSNWASISNLFTLITCAEVTVCGQIRDCRLYRALLNSIMTVLSQIGTQILIKPYHFRSDPVTEACLFFSTLKIIPTVLGTLIQTDLMKSSTVKLKDSSTSQSVQMLYEVCEISAEMVL